ncbi:hypothetical protein AgCh_025927 [Apium graveolens]
MPFSFPGYVALSSQKTKKYENSLDLLSQKCEISEIELKNTTDNSVSEAAPPTPCLDLPGVNEVLLSLGICKTTPEGGFVPTAPPVLVDDPGPGLAAEPRSLYLIALGEGGLDPSAEPALP